MADINVERKSGPNIWPWVLGLLLVAALIWGLTQMTGNRDTRTTGTDRGAETTPAAERTGPATGQGGATTTAPR